MALTPEKKVKNKVTEVGCHGDEDFASEWCSLLEDNPDRNYLQSNFPNRHRQISETHTCSDGTDVDTTDSVTGGFDVSNRVRKCNIYIQTVARMVRSGPSLVRQQTVGRHAWRFDSVPRPPSERSWSVTESKKVMFRDGTSSLKAHDIYA